jgi:phage-related protein (TIGR01555 family)
MPNKPRVGVASNPVKRADGIENLTTRSGRAGLSKRGNNVIVGNEILGRNSIHKIMISEGLGRKIIERFPKDATRKGFYLSGGDEEQNKDLIKEFKRLKGGKNFFKLMSWGRGYGTAIMVMVTDDSPDLMEPLNISKVTRVDSLNVYAAGRNNNVSVDYDGFGQPEYYTISKSKRIKVHASRVIRFDGVEHSYYLENQNNNWGFSVLQDVLGAVKQLLSALAGSEEIIDDWVTGVLSIENLFDMLRDPKMEAELMKRIKGIDLTKSNANSIIIDNEEQYQKHNTSASGADKLIEKFFQNVSGLTDYPQTVLFGTSPGGLNATGESDINLYYDMVGSMQNNEYEPVLRPLFEVLAAVFGVDMDELVFEFFPLKEQSGKELMEEFKLFADAIEKIIATGAVSNIEIRDNIELKGYMTLDKSKTVTEPEEGGEDE